MKSIICSSVVLYFSTELVSRPVWVCQARLCQNVNVNCESTQYTQGNTHTTPPTNCDRIDRLMYQECPVLPSHLIMFLLHTR